MIESSSVVDPGFRWGGGVSNPGRGGVPGYDFIKFYRNGGGGEVWTHRVHAYYKRFIFALKLRQDIIQSQELAEVRFILLCRMNVYDSYK